MRSQMYVGREERFELSRTMYACLVRLRKSCNLFDQSSA